MRRQAHDVVICGAGHNGLVAAAYLARAGLDVLVLERRHIVGGACATEETFAGFHVSSCAYILHNLKDRVAADLELARHGLRVMQPSPRSITLVDGGRFLVDWGSGERTIEEAAKFGRSEGEALRRWEALLKQGAGVLDEFELAEPPTLGQLFDRYEGTELGKVLAKLAGATVRDLLHEFFDSDALKSMVLARDFDLALDEPGAPLAAAAMHTDWFVDPRNQGIVEGGMGSVTWSLLQAALEAGATLRLGAEVKSILLEDGHAAGVELIDGQVIAAATVISNADPKRTFLSMLDRTELGAEVVAEVESLDTSVSCVKFHAAVDALPDLSGILGRDFDPRLIACIRICRTPEVYYQAGSSAAAGQLPAEPVLSVQIPTVYDRTSAPDGLHIVSMWCRFYPAQAPGGDWSAHRVAIGEQLIDQFTAYAPNFRRSIRDWCVYTPGDIETRVYMTDGSIRHSTMSHRQLLADRLFGNGGHRSPVDGLYLCGAGTHPGGEVSGAPGFNAAQAVLADRA